MRQSGPSRRRIGLVAGLAAALALCEALLAPLARPARAADAVDDAGSEPSDGALPIDWPTTLALAGAENLEVENARAQIAESRAQLEQTRARFFPWIEPSVAYRRHEGRLQDVVGQIIDTDRQAYEVGAALVAEIDLGKSLFDSLAARQRLRAAEAQGETARRESVARAAGRYLELARAEGALQVAAEAVRIADAYTDQLERAVEIGIAFRGDAHRARARAERNRQLHSRARVDRRVAAAELAGALDLDPAVDLRIEPPELAVWQLVDLESQSESALIERALADRPEVESAQALLASAAREHDAVRVGAWLPTLGARASVFGLGGGEGDAVGRFGDGQDYGLGLRWRIGPGGLFDPARSQATAARARQAELARLRTIERVKREVVEAHVRARALVAQQTMAERMLAAAEEALRLSRDRRAFGVGSVLETLSAEEELTRARLDFVALLAEANRAQIELQRAIGADQASKSGNDVMPRN